LKKLIFNFTKKLQGAVEVYKFEYEDIMAA